MPLKLGTTSSEPGFGHHIPDCFGSLEEAQNSFYYHRNRCTQAVWDLDAATLHANPASLLVENAYLENHNQLRGAFRNILQNWCVAFEALLIKDSASMDSKALQGAAVLKINHRVSSMHLQYDKQTRLEGLKGCDPLLRECEEIIDLATSVVKLHKSDSSHSSLEGPIFFMDMNIVGPLFGIAHMCRDPLIRRRAIALLYSTPRQEGLWNSLIAARVAEKVMNVEEAGLGEVKSFADIPEENRIFGVDMQFDLQGRKGYLQCSRRQRTGKHIYVAEPMLEVFHETIEW